MVLESQVCFSALLCFPILIIYMSVAAAAKSLQSCSTLYDPIDGSPPGSPIPGILQAKTLEWVTISFSNAWKWKVKVKSLSRVRLFVTPWTAAYQAPPSMGFSMDARVLELGAIVFAVVKNLFANAGDAGGLTSILELGSSPGEGHGNPLPYSCLENPIDKGAWWATVQGVAKIRTRLRMHTYMCECKKCFLLLYSTKPKHTKNKQKHTHVTLRRPLLVQIQWSPRDFMHCSKRTQQFLHYSQLSFINKSSVWPALLTYFREFCKVINIL